MDETIPDMLKRVGSAWQRKADTLNARAGMLELARDTRKAAETRARAATWGDRANYALAKGTLPIDKADPELMLGYGPEIGRILREAPEQAMWMGQETG